MYHYVNRGEERPPFGYYHLDRGDFAAQLDHFREAYDVVDRAAFLATMRGERAPRDDEVVLTFDDGLADHYDHVLPELEARDMWGIFYVPAGPYLHGGALDVHRIHALLGAAGGEAVAAALDDLVDESMLDEEHVDRFEGSVYDRQDNEDATERAKTVLNYYVADDARGRVIDELDERLMGGDGYHDDIYMSRDELRALREAGMTVGSHAVTHRVMSTLSADEQRAEIETSFDFLEDVLGELPVRTYCHPYGGEHSYTDETLETLEAVGCEFSFDVNDRDLAAADVDTHRHRLPRYDCNDFPHGEATVSLG